MGAVINYYPPVGGMEAQSLSWLSRVADFVAAKSATLTNIAFRSTCNAIGGEVGLAAVSGTATSRMVRLSGSTNVAIRTSSGTTANSFQRMHNNNLPIVAGATIANTLVSNGRTSLYAVATQVIIQAVNNTCDLTCCNMADEATADAYLGVTGATSQTNFSLKIGAAAAIDTGVAIATVGTTPHDLIMIADGTNINAYIDFATTSVGTGLQNTAANAACLVNSYAFNGATASNVSYDLLQWAVFVA